jgi:hypothetical protein
VSRTVIDLDARATILDAYERITASPVEAPVVLVVAADAPFARNAVFLEVARQAAGARRLSIVSSDPRARSIAASVHLAGYASLGSLEREELDPTERLGAPRRAALASVAPKRGAPSLRSPGRTAAMAASAMGAVVLLVALALPSATVTVAATAVPMPPATITLRAGAGGDMSAQPLSATINAKVTGTATGTRNDDIKAAGSVRFMNQTQEDITIQKGTVVQTTSGADRIQFATMETKTLPRSFIIGIVLSSGQVDVPVEAVVGGPAGNVGANRIVTSNRVAYAVTNPLPTTGGDTKKIPVVRAEDYSAATAKASVDRALADAANDQKLRWKAQLTGDSVVYVGTPSLTSQGPLADVVGREVATFDVPLSAAVQGFAVAGSEPARTAVERYRAMATEGNALDERTAQFAGITTPTVGDNGVTWRLVATGQQSVRITKEQVGRAVAGRSVSEARALLQSQGLRVSDIRVSPSWWPRMPLLDARITIN